jgi:hypothetical protein
MDRMDVTFTPTAEDRRYAVGAHLRPVIRLAIMIGVLLLGNTIWWFEARAVFNASWGGLSFVGPLSPALLFLCVAVPLYLRRTALNKASLAPESLRLNDNGVALPSSGNPDILPWSTFSHYAENKKTFVLVRSQEPFFFVPKRALPPGDEEQLRALLKRHLSRK